MNILFVDDEVQVIQYMNILIPWKEHGYNFQSATNGEEACRILASKQIDIMCLDLTMPVMNGFEVLDWMKKNELTNVEVIIMSCHDEFEIVKRAMKYQCHDFILKNSISAQNILQILEQVKVIKEDKVKEKSKYLEIVYRAEENEKSNTNANLMQWLLNPLIKVTQNPFSIASNRSENYGLLSISINNYEQVIERYSNSDINQFAKIFESMIHYTFIDSSYHILKSSKDSSIVIFNFISDENLSTIEEQFISNTALLKTNFDKLMDISTCIVATDVYHDFNETQALYQKVVEVSELQFFYSNPQPYYINNFLTNDQKKQVLIHQFINDLYARLISNQHNYFDLILDQFVEYIREEHFLISPKDFISAIRNALFLYIEKQNLKIGLLPTKDYKSFVELKSELQLYMKPFNVEDSKNLNYAVSKAIMYIKNNYEKDIHLQLIAEHLEMSGTYLSRIFSQEMGVSITQFITEYRIDTAKKLIQDTSLKFYEIGEKVGFKSSIMFSSTFKKITGITPGQYRDEVHQSSK